MSNLTAKELKLMKEYALNEAQHVEADGNWYEATYHENVVRLIEERHELRDLLIDTLRMFQQTVEALGTAHDATTGRLLEICDNADKRRNGIHVGLDLND